MWWSTSSKNILRWTRLPAWTHILVYPINLVLFIGIICDLFSGFLCATTRGSRYLFFTLSRDATNQMHIPVLRIHGFNLGGFYGCSGWMTFLNAAHYKLTGYPKHVSTPTHFVAIIRVILCNSYLRIYSDIAKCRIIIVFNHRVYTEWQSVKC